MKKESVVFHNEIKELQAEFEQQLQEQVTSIKQAWNSLKDNTDASESLNTLFHHVHRVSGSAASFGFKKLGEISANIESKLKDWREQGKKPSSRMLDDIDKRITSFIKQFEKGPEGQVSFSAPSAPLSNTNQLIYLLEDDEIVAKDIQIQLERFGYHIQSFHKGCEVIEAVSNKKPDGMLVDLVLPDSDLNGVETVAELNKRFGDADYPIVFLTARDDIEARIEVAKVGSAAFYVKPIDIPALAQRLSSLTNTTHNEPFRILIVDDDKALSAQYALWLKSEGMVANVVNDPLKIIESIKKSEPDLILLDLAMPSVNGVHLARVIRQFDEYLGLPIVYLSAEKDVNKQISALRVGGDDFLVKPIFSKDLVTSVRSRAQRARDIKNYLSKDSLTGLNAHGTLLDKLSYELNRSRRNHSNLVFALLDVDLFKTVNDRFGHLEGDKVLKSLANILNGRLRVTDTIGRYGGEEFGIILPECDLDAAYKLINEIREDFSKINFMYQSEEYHVTFSAGLAQISTELTTEAIIELADQALYRAKDNGRNRIEIAKHQIPI